MAENMTTSSNTARCALVTGGAKRLGQSMVRYLAQQGFDVAIHCNQSAHEASALSHQMQSQYPQRQFPVVCHNLANWQQTEFLFEKLPAGFGPLDVLINNASTFLPGSLSATTADALETNFAVHLFSPLLLMKAFKLKFGKGIVVNMLDTKVVTNEFSHSAYLLSKKSLADATLMAALEWAPDIRVNGIAPGPVLPATGGQEASFSGAVASTPLKQPVTLAEINAAVGYLINCEHVTGQVLYLDSGNHLK